MVMAQARYKKFERCPPGNTTSEFATAYFAVTEVTGFFALDSAPGWALGGSGCWRLVGFSG